MKRAIWGLRERRGGRERLVECIDWKRGSSAAGRTIEDYHGDTQVCGAGVGGGV